MDNSDRIEVKKFLKDAMRIPRSKLEGTLLNDRYQIGKFIDRGC